MASKPYGFKSSSSKARFDTMDISKLPYRGAQMDYRIGEDDIGMMMNFEPYESGYCFLTVMATPRMMWTYKNNPDIKRRESSEYDRRIARRDARDMLLDTFVRTIEKEFSGLSGLEDFNLSTSDISNNVTQTPIVTKNEGSPYVTVSTNYTEKSGLPLTKFLDLYHRYIYDPYTQVKTYGGRIRGTNGNGTGGHTKKIHNETFTLLYVITDRTCLLVEKAFILYHAYPMNTPISTIGDNTKFEVDKKDITINWQCQLLDGPLANRLGTVYVRELYDKVLSKHLNRSKNDHINSNTIDWHYTSDATSNDFDIFSVHDLIGSKNHADLEFKRFKSSNFAKTKGLLTNKYRKILMYNPDDLVMFDSNYSEPNK